MTVQPWEPVSGWFVPANRDPVSYDAHHSWDYYPGYDRMIERSSSLAKGGSCRITLANGQKIIVRAKR